MNVGFIGQRIDVARRLGRAGIRVFASGPDFAVVGNVTLMPNAVAVARALAAPRITMLDLADGFATELAIQDVWPECAAGDVIVDFGRGTRADGQRRAAALASVRMHFIDATLSEKALHVGGEALAIAIAAPYFDGLGVQWTHKGPPGSGYHAALNERFPPDT